MKNRFLLILVLISTLIITGCANTATCSYCGETKQGKKYDVLGVERFICDDCIKKPNSTSNNVITEYKAEELDPYYITSANQQSENDSEPTDVSDDLSPILVDDTNLSNDDLTDISNTARTHADIISAMTSLLSSNGLSLIQDEENSAIYQVKTSSGDDANIRLLFSSDSSPKLSIEQGPAATSSNYTNTCISAALAFLDSTDVSGTGYNVYNNTVMHGNFTLNNCRFYYMEEDSSNSENNACIATFDISFQ